MPRCIATIVCPSGTESECSRAGLVDPTTGLHLCAKHQRLGVVSSAGAVELVRSALQPERPRAIVPPGRRRGATATNVFTKRSALFESWSAHVQVATVGGFGQEPLQLGQAADFGPSQAASRMDGFVQQLSILAPAGRSLSLWDDLGGDPAGLLNADEAAAVRAACTRKLRQLCIVPQSSLSDDFDAFNSYLSWSLLPLIKPPDAAAARRAAYRAELAELQLIELGPAKRGEFPTDGLLAMRGDLARFNDGALVVPLWEDSTIGSVLAELGKRAKKTAGDNRYIRAVELTMQRGEPVALPEHNILILPVDPDFCGSYLDWPAVRLPPASELIDGDGAYQRAMLCGMFSYYDGCELPRSTKFAFGGHLRSTQQLPGRDTKVHVEFLVGTDATGNRLCDLEAALPPGSESLCGKTNATMTAKEVKEFRLRLRESVQKRLSEAGSKALGFEVQIDHLFECWVATWVLAQFSDDRNLELLDEQDLYRLYAIVKSLLNSGKNAMPMSEVRNQRHALLSDLIATGHSMAQIDSSGGREYVRRIERHTHRNLLIDYSSGSEPLPWAVDAATMLEGFHSFAEELFLIGEQEVQGSRLQRAVYTMAKWIFDMGDGARL
jgi:hypothetical protein